MNKVNNALRIPTSLDGNFFKLWIEFLRPLHKLTNREIDVIASFIKHRYLLSKAISDAAILDRITLSKDTQKEVIKDCGITLQYLQTTMSKFRKNGVIANGRINPKFIPNINDKGMITLLLCFDLK